MARRAAVPERPEIAALLDSGSEGLGRWRDHRRDLAADFETAFGEAPGPLRSVAFMTDGDNTQQQVRAWYGAVSL